MRLLRRIVLVASLVSAALALAALMLLATLHTDPGRAIARDRLAMLLARATQGRVRLGALETPSLGRILLRDLVLSIPGQGVLRARRVDVALGLPLPVPPTLRLRSLRVHGLTAHLVHQEPSSDTAVRSRSPFALRIDDLAVHDGRLGMRLYAEGRLRRIVLSSVSLQAALAAGPSGLWLALAALEAKPRGVPLEPITAALTLRATAGGALHVSSFDLASGATRLAGAGAVDPDGCIDLRLHAGPLAPTLLAPVTPALELPAGSNVDLVLRGPRSALAMTASADLAAAGRVGVRARVDTTRDPPTYRAALEARDFVPNALQPGWPSEPLRASVRGVGEGSRVLTHGWLDAESAHLAWHGRAGLGAATSSRMHARGEVRDLARLTGGPAGRFPFRLDAEAMGALPRPARARGALTIGRGMVAGTAIAQASARVRLHGSELHIQQLRIEGDGMRAAADGRVDLERRTLDANLDLRAEGRGGATASLALARERGTWTGRVREMRLAPDGLSPWTSEGPAALALRDEVGIDGLRLRSGEQRAVLSAAVGAGGALTGAFAVSNLQLAPLCRLTATTCEGVANGQLDLSGRTAAPRLSLSATARELSAGPVARSTVDASLRYEAGRAAGTVTVGGLGGSVVVAGSAPAPLPGFTPGDDALDLTVTARDLTLARLPAWAPHLVRSASGSVRADLRVGGTWSSPRPDGTLALRAPVLELVASGARWEDVTVDLRADGSRGLVIERLTAAGGQGTLTGSGRLAFDAGVLPTIDARLVFDRFLAVDRPVLQAAVNGRLRVSGPLTGPTVRGRLYVPEGAVRPAFLPAANARSERDPTIEVVGLPEDVTVAPAPGLGELTLGLTVTLGNGMRIRRRDADVQLGGTLYFERTPPKALEVRGTVEIERGWYTFSGRRFTMRSGQVRFDGGPVGGAQLDLEATHRAGEYDVTVAVQGTIAKPALLLSSDPPLDETDVLAVLLVGRPSGELNDSERLNVQAEAASLAMGYVVPGLTGAFEDALPLEQVQVSPEQIRVGHHIGNDVFVSLSQQFVGWAGQTMAVEYSITRRLSVELSTSSRGSGAIDFFWHRRY